MLKLLRSRTLWCVVIGVGFVVAFAAPQLWGWYQLRRGQTELAQYHPELARQALESCLRIWPNHAHAHLLASRAARLADDLNAAVVELHAAQRLSGGATDETAFEWALIQASAGNIPE